MCWWLQLGLPQCALSGLTGWRASCQPTSLAQVKPNHWRQNSALCPSPRSLKFILSSPDRLLWPSLVFGVSDLASSLPSGSLFQSFSHTPEAPGDHSRDSTVEGGQERTLAIRTDAKSCRAWASSTSLICGMGALPTSQSCCKAIRSLLYVLETPRFPGICLYLYSSLLLNRLFA